MSIISRGDSVEVSVYSGGGWITPANQTEASLSRSKDAIDLTSKDSAGDKQAGHGFRGWEMSMSAIYDTGDSGMLAIESAFDNNTDLNVRAYDGTNYFTGYAVVTSFEKSFPLDDKVTYSCTFQGDGALAKT